MGEEEGGVLRRKVLRNMTFWRIMVWYGRSPTGCPSTFPSTSPPVKCNIGGTVSCQLEKRCRCQNYELICAEAHHHTSDIQEDLKDFWHAHKKNE